MYTTFGIEDTAGYDKIKNAILNAYELIPEEYRLKFRNFRKFENHTFMEFA